MCSNTIFLALERTYIHKNTVQWSVVEIFTLETVSVNL